MSCASVLIVVVVAFATTSAQLTKGYLATATSVKMGPNNMANSILNYEFLLDKDTQQITGSMVVLKETEPIRYSVTTMEKINGKWVLLDRAPFTVSGLMSELQEPLLSTLTCGGQIKLNDQGGFLPGACTLQGETMDTMIHNMSPNENLSSSLVLNLTSTLFGYNFDTAEPTVNYMRTEWILTTSEL